ncbi:DUF1330 domain-containing protein [Roseibium aestuarii]|uniref:DUF1330 domain-containing protein n=1 Tax=Roseibium aestuarii TaxID=2600299 RepID=A0ABW4JZ05_9HYPH|nr:DUF1330 domain-containing protein [Roseibium aestuarii]
MPKAYWIARIDVQDPETYAKYVAGTAGPFAKYKARFLVRGGDFESLEGQARSRNVVIEFEDRETALACYHSPEYQAAKAFRVVASEGELMIVDGFEGPQPAA